MEVLSICAVVEWCCKNAACTICRRPGQCRTQGRRDYRVRARTRVVCHGHTPAHLAASREWGLVCCPLRSTLRTCCKWPGRCSLERLYRNARPRTVPRCSVSPPPRALCTPAASGPKCTWQHLLTIRTPSIRNKLFYYIYPEQKCYMGWPKNTWQFKKWNKI